MNVYLDSSALAKRYVAESGTDEVLAVSSKASGIFISAITVPEVLSAMTRHLREGRLSRRQYATLKSNLVADVAEANIVNLNPSVIGRAVHCLEKSAIRTLDALHVASALAANCDLFVSADRRQCRVAKDMGLTVTEVA